MKQDKKEILSQVLAALRSSGQAWSDEGVHNPLELETDADELELHRALMTVRIQHVMVGGYVKRESDQLRVNIRIGEWERGPDHSRSYDVRADGVYNRKKLLEIAQEFAERARVVFKRIRRDNQVRDLGLQRRTESIRKLRELLSNDTAFSGSYSIDKSAEAAARDENPVHHLVNHDSIRLTKEGTKFVVTMVFQSAEDAVCALKKGGSL